MLSCRMSPHAAWLANRGLWWRLCREALVAYPVRLVGVLALTVLEILDVVGVIALEEDKAKRMIPIKQAQRIIFGPGIVSVAELDEENCHMTSYSQN